MEKTQDSGLTCFMIVMKFHGISIAKKQAENLSMLDPEQKTGEIEIIESAKKAENARKALSAEYKQAEKRKRSNYR